MDVISKEHRERGQASIYNIKCAFCSSSAAWKSKTNHKPSYYCDEHKKIGLTFGFLEEYEIQPLSQNIRG